MSAPKKIHLINNNDGSYSVYKRKKFMGIVRKINSRRWTCAPLGAGADPCVEVTEHFSRQSAVRRLDMM